MISATRNLSQSPARLPQPFDFIVDEILAGVTPLSTLWHELAPIVDECAASDDPVLRHSVRFFQRWALESLPDRLSALERKRQFDQLYADTLRAQADGVVIDPRIEYLAERHLTQCFLLRGSFELASHHSVRARQLALELNDHTLAQAALTSIGFVMCMEGYVSDGIGLITQSAPYVGEEEPAPLDGVGCVRIRRIQIVDLAAAYEHSRGWAQALSLIQAITTMISPGETNLLAQTYRTLARCLFRTGEADLAQEIFDPEADRPDPANPNHIVKHYRTAAMTFAARGDLDRALEACQSGIDRMDHHNHGAWVHELVTEASTIAREFDEPHRVIELLGDSFDPPEVEVSLIATFAYRDLAWAFARLGDIANARRYRVLAGLGQSRFSSRRELEAAELRPVPPVLISVRETHRRSEQAYEVEQQALRRAIGSAVHDVRTPLQNLELSTELRQDGSARWPVSRMIRTIDDTLGNLLHEVDMGPTIRLADLELAALVDKVIDTCSTTAAQKQIDIECEVLPHLRCRADPVALERVVANIVSNAIKYSPRTTTIRITASPIGADLVDLHVEDAGAGVPNSELGRLFRWGGRLSNTPTDGETQHGIGLYTAHRLASQMHATIRAHPRTSHTLSAFSIRLQRSQP